jgi:hypothetical protein
MPVPRITVSLAPVDEDSLVAWFGWGDAKPPVGFDPHLSLTVSIQGPAIVGKLRMQPIELVDLLDSLCKWARFCLGASSKSTGINLLISIRLTSVDVI